MVHQTVSLVRRWSLGTRPAVGLEHWLWELLTLDLLSYNEVKLSASQLSCEGTIILQLLILSSLTLSQVFTDEVVPEVKRRKRRRSSRRKLSLAQQITAEVS